MKGREWTWESPMCHEVICATCGQPIELIGCHISITNGIVELALKCGHDTVLVRQPPMRPLSDAPAAGDGR